MVRVCGAACGACGVTNRAAGKWCVCTRSVNVRVQQSNACANVRAALATGSNQINHLPVGTPACHHLHWGQLGFTALPEHNRRGMVNAGNAALLGPAPGHWAATGRAGSMAGTPTWHCPAHCWVNKSLWHGLKKGNQRTKLSMSWVQQCLTGHNNVQMAQWAMSGHKCQPNCHVCTAQQSHGMAYQPITANVPPAHHLHGMWQYNVNHNLPPSMGTMAPMGVGRGRTWSCQVGNVRGQAGGAGKVPIKWVVMLNGMCKQSNCGNGMEECAHN